MTAKRQYIFTSESVSEGHPDKIADQISDAVLDSILEQDPNARVAVETYIKTGLALIGGEVTTNAWVDIEEIARNVIREIGYTSSEVGFDGSTCGILNNIGKQSSDINRGVDREIPQDQGAGDQGLVFGYATDETEVFLPAPITYAHRLAKRQAQVRKEGIVDFILPDAKSQVSFVYENNKVAALDTILISTQHKEHVTQQQVREAVIEEIIKPVIPSNWITPDTKILVNPTGKFIIGGPMGDCGLTGRKIIVDTYGGAARHGGGAFSGKDPSKVDRSAAYYARYVAKNIVAAKLAKRCEIQISYAIGVAHPTSIYIETFGTNTIPEERIEQIVKELFDFRPYGIITELDLIRPIYRPTATYGHFGNDIYPWEQLSRVEELISLAK